ncbi:MAG: ROK family transcriptional regulator [Pseudonocardiaceae bacterium]
MSGDGERFRPGSQTALRSANQQRVVTVLQSRGELTQAQIARETGLAPATVSNIVRELTSEGVLVASGAGGRGRAVRLARSAGLAAGIDFGHRHVTVAVCDMAHEILAERRVDLSANIAASDGLERAAGLLEQALAEIGSDLSAVVGIGMGLPAPLDSRTGEVGALSILPGWVGVDAARLASERFGTGVEVDNDANLGALAEHAWGAGAGIDNIAYLKLSEGVGAGLVLNGELFRGRNGIAGEVGHTTFDEFGAVCRCGSRGCVETIVAARSVIELLEPRRGPGLTIADVVELAAAGDTACARVLADTGRQAGIAVANLCNMVNPERILIGGELALAGELLLAPLREAVRRCGMPSATTDLEIHPAALGARAHVLGAIALVLRTHALWPPTREQARRLV